MILLYLFRQKIAVRVMQVRSRLHPQVAVAAAAAAVAAVAAVAAAVAAAVLRAQIHKERA